MSARLQSDDSDRSDGELSASALSGGWIAFFWILSLILAAETFISACFLYDLSSDIHSVSTAQSDLLLFISVLHFCTCYVSPA